MSESNVIRGHFGMPKGQPEKVQQESELTEADYLKIENTLMALLDYDEERIELDVAYLVANEAIVQKAVRVLEALEEYLKTLELSENSRRVILHRRTMRTISIGALCEMLIASSRKMWGERPTFYRALSLEYGARFNCILAHESYRGSFL